MAVAAGVLPDSPRSDVYLSGTMETLAASLPWRSGISARYSASKVKMTMFNEMKATGRWAYLAWWRNIWPTIAIVSTIVAVFSAGAAVYCHVALQHSINRVTNQFKREIAAYDTLASLPPLR